MDQEIQGHISKEHAPNRALTKCERSAALILTTGSRVRPAWVLCGSQITRLDATAKASAIKEIGPTPCGPQQVGVQGLRYGIEGSWLKAWDLGLKDSGWG